MAADSYPLLFRCIILFKLWRTDRIIPPDWDCCIVNADTEVEARSIASKAFDGLLTWVDHDTVSCEVIGWASPLLTRGIVLASHIYGP